MYGRVIFAAGNSTERNLLMKTFHLSESKFAKFSLTQTKREVVNRVTRERADHYRNHEPTYQEINRLLDQLSSDGYAQPRFNCIGLKGDQL